MSNRLPLKDRLKDHPLMAALAKRSCRLCGYPFVPEEPGQLYCCEYCESTDRKIDEAESRREGRADV
jgi:hypothetical protein